MIVMNIFSILVSMLPLAIMLLVVALPESSEFRQGFEIGIGGSMDAYMLGQMFGRTAMQIGLIVILLVAILSRKYKLTVGILILKVVAALSSPLDLIWAVIMLLIVLINRNCKQYIKGSAMAGTETNSMQM